LSKQKFWQTVVTSPGWQMVSKQRAFHDLAPLRALFVNPHRAIPKIQVADRLHQTSSTAFTVSGNVPRH